VPLQSIPTGQQAQPQGRKGKEGEEGGGRGGRGRGEEVKYQCDGVVLRWKEGG